MGLEHKLAMTVVYISGVILTFLVNRSWSFQHSGVAHTAFIRYVLAYVIGYFVNLGVLWLAVDQLRLPHQMVQAMAILLVAVCMFLFHKYWVFAPVRSTSN
jgi:putative flippase GtrA